MANSNKNDTINESIWSDTGDEVFSLVKDEVVQANRGDKMQLSSGSSTLSNSKEKKKTKLGSLEEKGDDEDESDADEWSDEELVITYKDAPVWARGMMSFLQKSVGAIKGRLINRFCNQKRPMDVWGGEGVLYWTFLLSQKTSIFKHTRLLRILVFPYSWLGKSFRGMIPPFFLDEIKYQA